MYLPLNSFEKDYSQEAHLANKGPAGLHMELDAILQQ